MKYFSIFFFFEAVAIFEEMTLCWFTKVQQKKDLLKVVRNFVL